MNHADKKQPFLIQFEEMIRVTAPNLSIETLPVGECSFITVIKNAIFKDLALIIEHNLISVTIGWDQIKSLNTDYSVDDGYVVARFLEFEENNWQQLALHYIKADLERLIFVTIFYLQKKPIKICYAIKLDDGQCKTIASQRLAKRKIAEIFLRKEIKKIEIKFRTTDLILMNI